MGRNDNRGDKPKSRTISTDKLQIENKTLFIDFKENPGGKFLQIAELSNDRRSTVVIPHSGLESFFDSLKKILEIPAANEEEIENA
ncbi:MAG: RNA-binding protein [Deltaproteobacteria bacterium]|nr:RNA-binding protein [Deltaproteobacteria bacterium]